MNLLTHRMLVLLCRASILSCMISVSCYANQVDIVQAIQKHHLVSINRNKIMAHEQYVARAQRRYRFIKPVLTACGVTFVLSYVWYTSSTLSEEEKDKIRAMLADHNKQEPFQPDWFKSHVTSIGGVAVELIGGALIIPPLSDLIGKLTGCAHVMSSLELYDKEYTHCNALITQIARDMQMNLTAQAAGKEAAIGVNELVNAGNRLVHRIEKLVGFMRVEVSKFSTGALRQEAYAIEKRLVDYTNELCIEMQHLIDVAILDYAAILTLIVQFAQQYAQEMQRFSFLEQDARENI